MVLVDEGRLALDARVQRYVPEFAGPMKDRVTIRHLLTHSAGLAADLPLYDSTTTRAAALHAVDTTTLLVPGGASSVVVSTAWSADLPLYDSATTRAAALPAVD